MNRMLYTSLVSWQTTNHRHQRKAENYCKDFGLIPLQKTLYLGTLYRSEYSKLNKKLKELLTRKKELHHSFILCSSCLSDSSIEQKMRKSLVDNPTYEIVQSGK